MRFARLCLVLLAVSCARAADPCAPMPPTNLRDGNALVVVPASVTVTWNMPTNNLDGTPLTDLAGAKIYYGTESSNYTTLVDAGMVEAFTVTGLVRGVTYYLNGTAYNVAGLESDFCTEVAKEAK